MADKALPPAFGAGAAAAGTSLMAQDLEGALKVAFVDDEEASFLTPLRQANDDLAKAESAAADRIDLRTLLATESNQIVHQLDTWQEKEGWRPDLLCIDLYEASGKGVAGTDYLRMMRANERWAGLPIVLTTKTEKPGDDTPGGEADLIYGVYQAGADGYLLGKVATRGFLKLLRQQMPAWRHHARSRVWRRLLEENHHAMQAAKGLDESKQCLQQTLAKLQNRLGINHAFVRKGSCDDCPVWVQVDGDWAKHKEVRDLATIPLMAEVIAANGHVTRVKKITGDQCGPYKALIGKAYMGCTLLLRQRFLGVMTVVCDVPNSFGPLDSANFERLAHQVAYVLGTQLLEAQQQTLRDGLLKFGEALSSTHDEAAVCQALADAAHRVVHDQLRWAKCTVRLVEPGYPLLRRYGQAGKVVTGADIPLRLIEGAADSMFRRSVTTQQVLRIDSRQDKEPRGYLDNNLDDSGRPWWNSESAITVPLLLDRPDSRASQPVRGALGAFNLECDQPAHYASGELQSFLESLALTAARHINALRTARFSLRALDLAMAAYRLTPEQIWPQVNRTLFALLGHNLLIQLEPPPAWDGLSADQPWTVRRVYSSDPGKYSEDVPKWTAHFQANDWVHTYTRSSVSAYVDQPENGPRFTADHEEFVQSKDLLGDEEVQANAVLPLWQHGRPDKRLSGVVLLSWFSPPVVDKAMFDDTLRGFADYCAWLLQHSADRQTGAERLQRAEDQAAIAFAARQFEHVLNNRLAALQGTAEAGLMAQTLPQAAAALDSIRGQLRRLDERAHKASLYLKAPSRTSVSLAAVWASVCSELRDKAQRHSVTLWPWGQVPAAGRTAGTATDMLRTDEAYLWNGLYVLVDNAIEALAAASGAGSRDIWAELRDDGRSKVSIRVHDNGPGVRHPERLFEWGFSTKEGQGVALALARDRLRLAGMTLRQHVDDRPGACFAIEMDAASGPEGSDGAS